MTRMIRALPTLEEVRATVDVMEPCTVMDVLHALGAPWEHRGTVRNRLDDLAEMGVLIVDEDRRPKRYAANRLQDGAA